MQLKLLSQNVDKSTHALRNISKLLTDHPTRFLAALIQDVPSNALTRLIDTDLFSVINVSLGPDTLCARQHPTNLATIINSKKCAILEQQTIGSREAAGRMVHIRHEATDRASS